MIITGAARGIGAELVKSFAQKGYKVVINYLNSEQEARRLSQEITIKGNERVLTIKTDVTKRNEVKAMFDQVMDKFGKVDILINNAGLNLDSPFSEMTDTQWQSVLAVNLSGTFICCQEFVFHFQGNNGHIINIGATTVFKGRKNGANYCSAKAGIVTLSKCLALELAPQIAVNCIIPGWIETGELIERYKLANPENLKQVLDTIPMRRLGTPADIFKTIDFIIDESAYGTGQNFFVNGGFFMY